MAITLALVSFTNNHDTSVSSACEFSYAFASSAPNCSGEWTEWAEFNNTPGIDYAVKCRKSNSFSDDNNYIWTMKIRNRLKKDIEFDYNFFECQGCDKYRAGKTNVRANSEKNLSSDYFTKTLACGSQIWVSLSKLEYGH